MTLIKVNQQPKARANFGFSPMFDEMFNDFFGGTAPVRGTSLSSPRVNIKEVDGSYTIEFAVPGFEKENFKIALEKNVLSVSAEKKNEQTNEQENYTRKEFHFSSFERKFTLPETVDMDAIKAEYVNGILQVQLPKKAELQTGKKEISVQ